MSFPRQPPNRTLLGLVKTKNVEFTHLSSIFEVLVQQNWSGWPFSMPAEHHLWRGDAGQRQKCRQTSTTPCHDAVSISRFPLPRLFTYYVLSIPACCILFCLLDIPNKSRTWWEYSRYVCIHIREARRKRGDIRQIRSPLRLAKYLDEVTPTRHIFTLVSGVFSPVPRTMTHTRIERLQS